MSVAGRQAALIAETWVEEFSGVMEAMGDTRPTLRISRGAPEPRSAVLWWMQPMDTCPGAIVWIGANEETWFALGNLVLAAAGVESGTADEVKGTWLEIVKQSLGGVARYVGSKIGQEVACTGGAEEAPGSTAASFQIAIGIPGRELHPIALCFSAALLEALQKTEPDPEAEPEKAPEAAAAEMPPEGDEPDLPPGALRKLELLLDVEMPVSVSFGSTQVRLRDVLKLITGSIIELDRSISEPVELIVNNCVIARGEVVVVDGNYGVRINEVMSRHQRLQQSRKFLLPVAPGRR